MLIVTTSWDDGDTLDERLAALLDRYEVKGTFYITRSYRPNRLSDTAIQTLAKLHEVGAHTLTHPDLRKISRENKRKEIAGSKNWLEDLIGKEVPMFCYPSGFFDDETTAVVQESNFKGARTTEFGKLSVPEDLFRMPTTLHVYPMPFRKRDVHSYYWGKLLQPFFQRAPAFRKLDVPLSAFRSWEVLARATFDIALAKGQMFHLWGHSWEIEKYDMWEPLERVLRYISERDNCRYVTNGEMLKNLL